MEIDENTGEVKVSEIQVPGIVKDDYGNTWTIPTDEMGYDELLTDPLKLPRKDPKFHYQFVRQDQVTSKMTEDFRPVLREEVGIKTIVSEADLGGPQTSYHQVHDLVLMKIPKQLADRRYRAAKRIADEAVQQITNPVKLAEAGGPKNSRPLVRASEPFEADASDPGLDHFSEPIK